MKKLISVLVLVLVLSMSGCNAAEMLSGMDLPPVPTANAAETESAEAPAESQTETRHQHIIINFQRSEQQAFDPQQGSELILSFSYETPYVHIPAAPQAEYAINEYIAMLDESYYTGDTYGVVYDSGCAPGYNNMLTMAEDNYNFVVNSGSDDFALELACHRTLSVQRCDERVLSLRYYDYINTGGIHGGYAYRGYNFDTVTGELLTLDNISEDSAALKEFLKAYMLESLSSSEELQQRIMGYVDVEGMPGTEEALAALLREGSWYLDDKGMLIFSDLYELCSYAEGTIEFLVPYNALAGYIKSEYIPGEISAVGSFTVTYAEELRESSKEIIDMLKLDEQGDVLYLVVDGTAENVRLAKVGYADRFYEIGQLWQCSAMSDCVLQLVTNIPEGMPELKISYSDAAGEHVLYLSQSGMDGSLILVDEEVEAVG